ncbi:MAG: MATE family efflux transporter, partial [Bacteroidales bacterium]
LFSSILIFALFQLFGTNILQFLIQTPAVRIAVKEYLYTRIYGLPFAFISLSFNAFYVGTARTRTISIATIIMGIVNVILDYIFIFGKLHCPAMGMQGAALASVIAEGIGLSVYFIKSITAVNYVRFRIFDKFNLHRTLFGHMINMSYPIMFQYFISFANYFLFFIFIETLGQKSLAIANITRSMYIIFLLPVWGYAATTASLTSFLCGQKRENEIFMVVKKAIILGVISVSIIVLPYLLFHNFILNLFTNDPNLATESFVPSLVCIVASFTMALGQIVFHTIIGQGKTKVSLGIDFVNLIFYILYAWYVILYLKSSVAVAFGVEIMYTVGLLIISCIYLYYTKHFSKKVLMDKQL